MSIKFNHLSPKTYLFIFVALYKTFFSRWYYSC